MQTRKPEADVIFFKNKAVLSDNINVGSNRCSWMNRKIDQCLKDGDEWPVRFKLFVPWAKMVKRDLVVKYNIRFDEVAYSNDVYFSLLVGYHAGIIKVANITLYVVTFRPKSLSAEFCTKPGELKTRAEVFFREEKFLIMHNICRVRSMRKYLLIMLKRDHSLFKYYFYQLDELYPSKLSTNMKTMHPTFSIIIPHKEIPDLLMRCLQSIPVSEDIQVIVVDDNSADADTYLERYPELSRPYLEFIRTTKGGGAGYARNVGLEHAKGKWLLFADADDFYVDDMYSIICSYVDSR